MFCDIKKTLKNLTAVVTHDNFAFFPENEMGKRRSSLKIRLSLSASTKHEADLLFISIFFNFGLLQ